MRKHLLLAGACFGAVLGASFVGVRADETSTSSTTAKAEAPQAHSEPDMAALLKKSHTPRSQIPGLSITTSVTLDYPLSSPKDALTLLKSPVAFSVKDASFLSALDAMMTASGKTCHIECRRVSAMKLSFSVKSATAGFVLHTLALAGNCSLYVWPDKLLIAAPDQLSATEKRTARLYRVVQSKANIALDNPLGQTVKVSGISVNTLAVANTKISVSLDNLSSEEAVLSTNFGVGSHFVECRVPKDRIGSVWNSTRINLVAENIKFGEVLATIAHVSGCELYLFPNKFLLCSPNELTPAEKIVAQRLYTPDSFKFNFDEPSAPEA